MLGIVAGLFCTLAVAGLCSYCMKMDFNWYFALNKPWFVASGGWFTLFVGVSYLSSILAVSRLVQFKHIFPSMIFFAILGFSCVMFVLCFFTLKNLVAAFVFITLVLAMSYVLFVRFLIKDVKIALEFLPAFIFNSYSFLCVIFIVMNN